MSRLPNKRPPILLRRRAKKDAIRAAEERSIALRMREERERAARGHLPVNPLNLAPSGSYGIPDFVRRGFYVDHPFDCKACGIAQVWSEAQQKWWY